MKIHLLTLLASITFAANSLLCRMALSDNLIDPASFTVLRLVSGAILLSIFLKANKLHEQKERTNWIAGILLFVYAVCFSYAYTELPISDGALILFAAVQLTFFVVGLLRGERPCWTGVGGMCVAAVGVVYLALPGLSTPNWGGAIMMAVGGFAMGIYSVFGKTGHAPLANTAKNFLVTIPLVLIFALLTIKHQHLSVAGIILAIASGAYASGVGYVFWYSVLPKLSFFQASSSQFTVPVFSALAGIVFLGEAFTPRFFLATFLVLAGSAMVVLAQARRGKRMAEPS